MNDITGMAPPSTPAADDPFSAGEAGVRVIRGGGMRVAGSLAGVLAGTISAPLVVRHLGVTDYGHYLTVTSVIFVVTALTEGGLANVAVRLFSVSDRERQSSLVANLTGLRLALGAIGALGAVGFGLLAGYESVIVLGLAISAAGYVLAAVQGSYSVALSGALRLPALAAIDLLRSLTTTALLVALVIAGSGLTGFFLVSVIVQAVALIVTAALVRHGVPLRPAFVGSRWRELLHETAVYALAATLGAVYFQVALIAMSLLDPGLQTGYYAIAFRIIEIVNGIPWLLAGSVLPVLAVAAESDHKRLRYVAQRVFEGAAIAGGWIAIVVVVGAGFAIQIIAGPKGHPSVPVLRIMAIGVTATFLVSSWGYVLLSLRMYRQLAISNGGALLLALALSLILIPTLHARGGAITTVALELSLASSYVVLLARRAVLPDARFLPRFALAAALGLGVGLLLLEVHAIVGAIGASIVYFGALWLLDAIPSELVDSLPWRR